MRLFGSGFGLCRLGQHLVEQMLQGHGVAAALAHQKEFAIAVEDTVLKAYLVIVVFATERDVEPLKTKSLALLRIALRLLDFSDHPVVHAFLPFCVPGQQTRWGTKKHASVKRRGVLYNPRYRTVRAANLGSYGRLSLPG